MLDLMLRIVGHVPRVSHVIGIFTQLWGTMQLMSPNANFWGTCPLCSPRGLGFLFLPGKFVKWLQMKFDAFLGKIYPMLVLAADSLKIGKLSYLPISSSKNLPLLFYA